MVLVRYKGKREVPIPVALPIGVKHLGEIREVRYVPSHGNRTLELTDSEAKALVALNPTHFELVEEPDTTPVQFVPEPEEDKAVASGTELDPDNSIPKPKKRGRPAKAV